MVAKGYSISHQKVSININLNGSINGYTEFTVVPTSSDLKVVWLNARSLNILSCSLRFPASIPLNHSFLPPLPPTLTEPQNVHSYPELKRSIWSTANAGEEGELGIAIPKSCVVKVGASGEEGKKEDEWEPFTFAVEYEVKKPGVGIVIVKPDDANPSRFPHVFTSPSSDIAARTWVPCSDYSRDRCTWDLEFIVPRVLYSGGSRPPPPPLPTGDDDEEEEEEPVSQDEEWPITVVASGELVEQVVHPDRSDRVIWHYSQATPVSVQQIAWAVGPFVVSEIMGTSVNSRKRGGGGGEEDGGQTPTGEEDEDLEDGVEGDKSDGGPRLHALCLPGREAEMKHSVRVIKQAMDFYTSTFGSYPFSTYTVAFIDSLASGSPTFHSAAMTLLSSDLLHPPSIIDQAYETRHLLAHALAVQWSGINLIPKAPSDNWLVVGIALHLTSLFLKSLWGNNEYRFRIKKDMLRCVAQDVQREPMSVPARHTQPEADQMQFIALKAPLVLHILDKHLKKSSTSLGLDKVLPKLFLDAITGDLGSPGSTLYNTLSTNPFIKTCRKACGVSGDALKNFFDQWVYGSGCPTFVVTASFNRKKMAIELQILQECLAHNWAATAPWEESGHLRPMPMFDGQMTIRIHEADGTPYEHVLNIQEQNKRHEVPFNTKYKRIRRNTKRYQARQAAATAAASGDQDAQEDLGMVDVGFGLSLWEDEKEREKWEVKDWTEEDDVVMSQATYEWIRIDAEMEWICNIQFEQPDFMWLSQLQRDRDVVAQLEAIHALSRMPSPIVSSNLAKTVLVTNYFFRIRMEACLALISCATKTQNYLGLFHLLKLFQSRYCFEPDVETKDPFAMRCIPKTNDFCDLTEYFLKKTLVTAISMVRDDKGLTPPVVQQFLIDLLAYNDNLGNLYSDTFYITTVIGGLAHAFVAVSTHEPGQLTSHDYSEASSNEFLQRAIEEVTRYINADRLVPSYHNAITVAGIEWTIKLTLACLIPEDRRFFFTYTRDGNYPPVRIAAFEALLLLNLLSEAFPLVRYMFSVMREDSSLLVQRRLAQATLQSLPVLAAVQDLAAPEMVFEEEGAAKKEKDAFGNILKQLRKKPGRSNNFRACLLSTLTHPTVDAEVRLNVLKLLEVTVKPAEEPIPKIRVRMIAGSNPVAAVVPESPAPQALPTLSIPSPQLPRIKLTSTATSQNIPKITIPRPALSPLPSNEYDPSLRPPEAQPKHSKKHKHKPPPKVEKSQSSGMEMRDVASCRSILKKLLKDKNSLMFRAPVDPVKSGAPGYFDIIKNPMDISTMNAKLQAGQYTTRDDFRADFELIVSNARLYNGQGPVVEQAVKLSALFVKQWDRVEATLRRMDAAPGAPTPPTPKPATNKIRLLPPSAPPTPAAAAPVASTSILPPAPPPRSVSFVLRPPPSGDATVRLPPPRQAEHVSSDLVKPPGFKITLGGSSMSPSLPALPSPSPSPSPAPPPLMRFVSTVAQPASVPKPPKPARSASFADDVEFARPALPQKIKLGSVEPSAGSGSPSLNSKPPKSKKGKEKDKDRDKEKEKEKSKEKIPVAPVDPYLAGLPLRPEILDTPLPPAPSNWFRSGDPPDRKKVRSVLNKMQGLREAFFFQVPVEAVGALATYYLEIKQPIDLQTMVQRVDSNHYATYGQVFDDFQLIVRNCHQFNPPNTEPVWHVDILDRAWRAEWEKASKLSYNSKRSLLALMKTLVAHGASFPFRESIATILDQIPSYPTIIPRENWRDLGQIRQKIEGDKYRSLDDVDYDMNLMLDNCLTFNGPEAPVTISGEELRKMWKVGLNKIRNESGNKGKRASEGKSGGGATKKQKV